MRIILELPDEVWTSLGAEERVVQDQIVRWLRQLPAPLGGSERPLVIDATTRRQLEGHLKQPLENGDDLLRVVATLATIKIGLFERPLSVDEAVRVQAYADSMGLPVIQAAQELFEPIVEEMFNRV